MNRICSANGCTNWADGTVKHGGLTVHTCIDCANNHGKEVALYE